MQIKLSGILLVTGITFLFSGCALSPKYDDTDEFGTEEFQDDYSGYDDSGSGKVKHGIGNPAVLDLWNQAESARLGGDYDSAVLHLERALRIAPNDAVMWSRLAEVRLSQGNANQAENLAAKSNAMTVDNPLLNYRNWLIIARARQSKGDEIGAQEAEYTANSFRP